MYTTYLIRYVAFNPFFRYQKLKENSPFTVVYYCLRAGTYIMPTYRVPLSRWLDIEPTNFQAWKQYSGVVDGTNKLEAKKGSNHICLEGLGTTLNAADRQSSNSFELSLSESTRQ